MTEPVSGTPAAPAAPAPGVDPSSQPAPAANPAPVEPAPNPPADPAPEPTPPAPAEPAPEVIGAEPETPAAAENVVAYQETGDAGLDLALDFIGNLGLGPDHDAVKAATDGNFDKLEATLEALGDKAKGYERYLALAKDAYTRQDTATKATQAEVTKVVQDVAGGADEWNTVKKWAGENADPSEKEAINEMLSAGPVQARAAAQLLLDAYRNASGTTVQPAEAVTNNAGNGNTGNGALSPAEYATAVRALRAQLGTAMEGSQDYANLRARRAAFRG